MIRRPGNQSDRVPAAGSTPRTRNQGLTLPVPSCFFARQSAHSLNPPSGAEDFFGPPRPSAPSFSPVPADPRPAAAPPRVGKTRLDCLLVARGQFPSREQAQRAILAGEILTPGGQRLDKPGVRLPEDAVLEVRSGARRFVGRGGWKLAAALDAFALDPAGRTCVDVGASTGGFTDCLLQRGAARVYAVDVGHGQLDWSLRQDLRVVVREKTNARQLRAADFPEPITLGVVDVSFISLTLVLPAMAAAIASSPGAQATIVALIKPQFELGRVEVSRGSGVIRDEAAHARAVEKIRAFVADGHLDPAGAWRWAGLIPSPLEGADGNKEFLAWLRRA